MPSKTAPPDLQHYQATIDALAVAAAGHFTAQTGALDWASPDIQAIITSVYGALVQSYRRASATVGLQMYRGLRDAAGIGGAPPRLLAPDADPDWLAAKVDNAFNVPMLSIDKLTAQTNFNNAGAPAIDEISATDFTGVYDKPVQQIVTSRLENSMQRMVASGSRETIVANVETDPAQPLGWARVPTSDHPCGFCIVMASRGFATKKNPQGRGTADHPDLWVHGPYLTKKSATEVTGRGQTPTASSGPGKRALGEKYHDNCSCIAVPVFKQLPPSVADHYEMYEKATANAGKGDLKSILASMRQIYGVR